MPHPDPASLSRDDRRNLFDQALRCIEREEDLIHYRLTWGMQWSAACLAAIFAAWQFHIPSALLYPFFILTALLGIFVGILCRVGIKAAHTQSQFVLDQLEARLGIEDHNWAGTEFIRPYGDPNGVHRRARFVSGFFPFAFSLFWAVVIIYAGYQCLAHMSISWGVWGG